MSSSDIVNSVTSYLASNHMHVDDEWLIGCVEYLTEDSSNNYSEAEIKNLAKEQWLLNDLKDICPGSLPANLKSQRKSVLNGRFVLQINASMDIGTPAYQQYLKLQKTNLENIEATTKLDDKIPNHRMIKLYLTDGVQEVSAIEYKPMRNLSCEITPGCKILLKGPLECRRGVILLNESAVELLGGEVQEIAVSNSLAGLVSTKLGLSMPQDSNLNTTINQPRNTNIPSPHAQMPSAVENSDTLRPVARVTSLQVAGFNDEDNDIDIDQLTAIEAQLQNPVKRPMSDINRPEKRLKINKEDDYPTDADLFLEDEEYLREIEAKFDERESRLGLDRPNAIPLETMDSIRNVSRLVEKVPSKESVEEPITVSSEPFVYIKQISEMSDMERAGRVFRVKGQIMKLLSKLSVGKDGWSLKCTLVDGTGSLNVDFTSDVLSKLVGFTPHEMNALKKQMPGRPDLKEKAVSALQKARDTLQVLYCIIELTMLEVPKITCLIPYEECHVKLLKDRALTGL